MSEWCDYSFNGEAMVGAVMCEYGPIIVAGPIQESDTDHHPLAQDPNWVRFYFARPFERGEAEREVVRARWPAVVFTNRDWCIYLPVADYLMIKMQVY